MFSRVFLFVSLGVINFAVFFLMIWGQNGLLAFQDLKKQLVSLQKTKVELDTQKLQLSHEIRLLKTDQTYQEKMIRQKLRYIRDNELVYIFDE